LVVTLTGTFYSQVIEMHRVFEKKMRPPITGHQLFFLKTIYFKSVSPLLFVE